MVWWTIEAPTRREDADLLYKTPISINCSFDCKVIPLRSSCIGKFPFSDQNRQACPARNERPVNPSQIRLTHVFDLANIPQQFPDISKSINFCIVLSVHDSQRDHFTNKGAMRMLRSCTIFFSLIREAGSVRQILYWKRSHSEVTSCGADPKGWSRGRCERD